ncbi:MAG TPA: DUF2865 domain-containing protein [Methyloceanibacter sp.]|jgi:hypothetical protein|nr:DUF2865 domain-containing protein [Methyloceanibacter sp.]
MLCSTVLGPAEAGTQQDTPASRGKTLHAVIASKLHQLVVLRRDLERFNCAAPVDEPVIEGCRQMAEQARIMAEEIEELKKRAGPAWTSEKPSAAEPSASRARAPHPKPYTFRWRTDPAMTYRTLCVRLCDGFYFPIGSASPPTSFLDEEKSCRARCAVPAKLFYQPVLADDAGGMVALTGERYSDLPNAFRYRSEYLEHCACTPRPWSAEAKAEYRRHAIIATRTWAERIVAAGAGETAKLLAEADIEVAERKPAVRATIYRRATVAQESTRRGLFWRFRGPRAAAASRAARPQGASQPRRFFLLRSR